MPHLPRALPSDRSGASAVTSDSQPNKQRRSIPRIRRHATRRAVQHQNDEVPAAGEASHALVTPESRNVACRACFMLGGEDEVNAC
jgi:hypothetical protein